MRNLLASFLALYWSAAFGLAAILCVLAGTSGVDAVFAMLGGTSSGDPAAWWSAPGANGALATALAAVSLLFVWAGITALFGGGERDGDDAARIAVAAAILLLTALLVAGSLSHVDGLAGVVALYVAGLGVSYIAAAAERAVRRSLGDTALAAKGARQMALGAVHDTLLDRYSKRAPHGPEKR